MYEKMSFWRYGIALIAVAAPAQYLDRYGERGWSRYYVLLVIVMLLVTHSRGLSAFTAYLSREMR